MLNKIKDIIRKLHESKFGKILKRAGHKAWSFIKKHKIISAVIAVALVIAIVVSGLGGKKKGREFATSEAKAMRMTISESITGSSVVEANAEYSVTPLVSGEILSADFEEGDIVEKDQILYEIDSSDTANSIKSSDLSIQRAEKNYTNAYDSISDLTVKSTIAGTVTAVYVSAGDEINSGAKIADVVNNTTIKATVPFNAADAQNIHTGEAASITLVKTGTVLSGRVISVSTGSETTVGSMRVSYVTIETTNPGAVSAGDAVTAMVGEYACNDIGTLESAGTKTITSKVSGTVARVSVVRGDNVSNGTTLAIITSDSVEDQVENANLSLQEAYLQRDKLYDQLDNYTIKAPISGTVVRKNKKAGDTIENGNSASEALVVIYDMSSLCFELNVDELDIKKMSVGQEVTITADAVEGRAYKGIVENVSINGTIGTNGITTYPIKVRIEDFDDNLLPGMNIEARITINESENALVVPVNAVNRGNTVYVKGNKEKQEDRAPEGYKTVQVETGITNDMFVEILSGLSEGDTVYVTPSADNGNQMMMPGMMGGRMPSGGMRPGGMPSGGMRQGGMPGGGMR